LLVPLSLTLASSSPRCWHWHHHRVAAGADITTALLLVPLSPLRRFQCCCHSRVVAGAAVRVAIASLLLLLLLPSLSHGHRPPLLLLASPSHHCCWCLHRVCCCYPHHHVAAGTDVAVASLLVLTSPSHCFWCHSCSHCRIATVAALAVVWPLPLLLASPSHRPCWCSYHRRFATGATTAMAVLLPQLFRLALPLSLSPSLLRH
jgi:hypothetical protein